MALNRYKLAEATKKTGVHPEQFRLVMKNVRGRIINHNEAFEVEGFGVFKRQDFANTWEVYKEVFSKYGTAPRIKLQKVRRVATQTFRFTNPEMAAEVKIPRDFTDSITIGRWAGGRWEPIRFHHNGATRIATSSNVVQWRIAFIDISVAVQVDYKPDPNLPDVSRVSSFWRNGGCRSGSNPTFNDTNDVELLWVSDDPLQQWRPPNQLPYSGVTGLCSHTDPLPIDRQPPASLVLKHLWIQSEQSASDTWFTPPFNHGGP